MRDIKFRAWHPYSERMLLDVVYDPDDWYSGDNVTGSHFMQFTGLSDKNGKEIYEGDIVDNYAITDFVVFDNGCFMLSRDLGCPTCHSKYLGMHDELEVIGNIYERGTESMES